MFKKILVALDSFETREQVLSMAITIAKAEQSDLMLLHVLSPDDPNCPQFPVGTSEGYFQMLENKVFETYYQQRETYQREQLQLLQAQQENAIAAGVKSELMLSHGSPGRIICDWAQTWQADLVVMGRRGRSGLGELLLGSTSTYVTHHTSCSVLIVQ